MTVFEKLYVTSDVQDVLPDRSRLDIHRTWGLLDEDTWAYEVSGTWNGVETFTRDSSIVNHLLDAVRTFDTSRPLAWEIAPITPSLLGNFSAAV